MNYAVAIISGLLFGIAVAAAKYWFIWRPLTQGGGDKIYGRMAISMAVNILALLAVFLIREYWPYSFICTIVAAAVGLSAGGQILSYISGKKAVSSADK